MRTVMVGSRGVLAAILVVAPFFVITMERTCAGRNLTVDAASGASSNMAAKAAPTATGDFAADVACGAAMRVLHFQHQSLVDRRGRLTIALSGPEVKAQVDQETGILVEYFASSDHRRTARGARPVTANQALASARSFAKRAGVSPDAWSLRVDEYLDYGPGNRDYVVGWVKWMDGVRLPAAISTFVDAETGDVYMFSLWDDPVVVPLQPRISADQAAVVVAVRMGYLHPVAESAELIVWYRTSYPGKQALLWRFKNMCDATALVDTSIGADVDAMTGELVHLSQDLGSGAAGMKHPGSQQMEVSPDKPTPVVIKELKKIDLPALKDATAPPTIFDSAPARKKR